MNHVATMMQNNRWMKWALTGLLMMTLALGATAWANSKYDWSAKDVKGRTVNTADYRGKVLLVFITSAEDDVRDKMKPITKQLVVKYGHNPDVDQLTIVDLSDAPLTWIAAEKASDEVTERISKSHDRTITRMNDALKKAGMETIPAPLLDKRLHIILDWEGKLVKKYPHSDTSKHVTIAVLDKQGNLVGTFKGNQLDKAMEAADATLAAQ